ncbi:MAG TPA: His/Gly/Thr/Pro-type tRNA ligase C-terminal domain-containing protein, partial [Candidatus Kapabacteria bacterium]|nr:His/Gly/Thr/Pro-type tRNA ligase C-terminal domain-containing protein [Candidatus Kapabacteria bacterium]
REWQISTIQLDMNMPTRFGLTYTDSDGTEKAPIMIHRALVGSPERFMGILLEHFGGALPVWLAPVQVRFCPVSSKHADGATALEREFRALGIRVDADLADETVGNKIRKAAHQKLPYVVVVGDKELGGDAWMIRVRGQEAQESMTKDAFIARVQKETKERT